MEVSVLQWNKWYEGDEIVRNFLLENKADIICLQELLLENPVSDAINNPQQIAERLGYSSYYYKEIPIESSEGHQVILANVIFSHFPMVDKTFTWINQPIADGGYDDEYRAYVEVTLQVGGKKLTVGTTHMSYTHGFKPTANKRKETNRLLEILATKKQNYVLTGDLNALPDSYTVTEISKVLNHAGPAFDQKTWTTKPFSYQGFNETELKWRLDYVFTSRDVEVLSTKIIKTAYSDHLPILTVIGL